MNKAQKTKFNLLYQRHVGALQRQGKAERTCVQWILELRCAIHALDDQIESLSTDSEEATLIRTIPGFGPTSAAELAGELGTIERFNSERSLALYVGMAPLDNASGSYRGTRAPRQVNRRAKAAMMAATAQHRRNVAESQTFYDRKRSEGKKHNQTVRALARHLCRVLFKMLDNKRSYEIR